LKHGKSSGAISVNAKKIASPVLFSVPHRDFVVALDFGGTKIDVATADLDGFLLQQHRIETDAPQGAEQAVERAFAVARTLIVRTVEMTGGCCLAVGVVSPGVILPDRVMLAPNIPGWEHLALRELVRGGLGIAHIAVGNDVKAAAMAEMHWGSLQGADPAIFLSLGTGIAAALIVGGQVITGAHGASGEIGYNLRGVAHETSVSRGHAPLEEVVGGRAIGEEGSRILGGNLSAAEVFTHPDIRARSLIEERLAELALHVANLAIFIDPMRIAVAGGLMSSGDVIIDTLTSCLRSAVPFPPEVMPARFVHEAALLGAVALALESLEIAPLRKTVLDGKGEIVIETNKRKKDPGSVSTS
jgi:glucokinase